MAVHVAVRPAHAPRISLGPILTLTLVLLALLVTTIWAANLTRVDEAQLTGSLRANAATVDAHATAMISLGERIASRARDASVPSAATWAGYGEHLQSDGRNLQALASRLSDAARVVETGAPSGYRADLPLLRSKWEHLQVDGRTTADHGRFMITYARTMSALAASEPGVISPADASELERLSVAMVDAGESTSRIASLLIASVDQQQRWIGRAP